MEKDSKTDCKGYFARIGEKYHKITEPDINGRLILVFKDRPEIAGIIINGKMYIRRSVWPRARKARVMPEFKGNKLINTEFKTYD